MPSSHKTDWADCIRRFQSTAVLVVGDLMLDRYWYGAVSRVSPEAPVVVVSKTHAVLAPGGAGNTAANIAALGGQVKLLGVCGRDTAAAELRSALAERGVGDLLWIEDPDRPTTVKTRVIAHQQHVVRIDEETSQPISPHLETRLIAAVEQVIPEVQAVILSDYAKGVLTESVLRAIIVSAQGAHKPVFVDPKARDAQRYRGASLLKPNRAELGLLANRVIRDRAATIEAATTLMAGLESTAILVTEGAEGMTLLRPGCAPVSFSGLARALYDVTGAGDTVIATLALALASGCDWVPAAELANHAAARVIEKLGTAACTGDDLLASVMASDGRS
jgi:rfaE bifunctional protein kinase chain/domain